RRRAADTEEVEHVEVDEERFIARTRERRRAVRRRHGLERDLLVVRERALADVPRRRLTVEDLLLLAGLLVDALELPRLDDVEVRAAERVDRAGVVEERVAVLRLVLERPAIRDVVLRVAVVV